MIGKETSLLVERHTRRPVRKNGRWTHVDSAVAVLGITSLIAVGSTPEHVATHIRDHSGHTSIAGDNRALRYGPGQLATVLGLDPQPRTAHDQHELLCEWH